MLRLFTAAICALALASCGPTNPPASAGSAPPPTNILPDTPPARSAAVTPLGNTSIDDGLIRFAFESYDAFRQSINALIAAGKIVPGTPRAQTIAKGMAEAQKWLPIASAAQQAGNATSYRDALAKASAAVALARAALK